MGGPATAGKRWPHFFQMGKLRHEEVWELAQVTHSESAFGRGQLPRGDKATQTSRFPSGSWDRQEGPRGQGCLGEHLAFPRGVWGGRGGLCLALGRAKSSEGARDGDILVRTAFLARQASTSKSRLKKGSRAVLKPERAPSSHSSPTLAGVCWATPHPLRGKGRRGDVPTVL